MSGGLSIDGLISGLDTSSIISQLLALKQKPIEDIQERISGVEDEKRAVLDVNSRMLALQDVAKRLRLSSSFNRSTVNSSNPGVLLATGDASSVTGSFTFYSKRLAASSQYVSNGFADVSSSPVSAVGGTMTVEVGDAFLQRDIDLANLRGGRGFDRGKIRITDDGGRSAIIDLTTAVTLQDVIDAINDNGVAQVTASINYDPLSATFGDSLRIENVSGIGNITVSNVGSDATATSLGIAKTSGAGSIDGDSINSLHNGTSLSLLNDGRGVNGGQNPATLTIAGSIIINPNLSNAKTLGDVLTAINTAGGGTITASLSSDGRSIVLNDTGAPGSITVTSTPGTTTAADLGLSAGVLSGGPATFTGRALTAHLGSTLAQGLNGVSGGGLGGTVAVPNTFDITDTLGNITTVTLTGREDLADLIAQIEGGPAVVSVEFNELGTGIQITDQAGGGGTLTIADTAGASAAALGLDGAHTDGVAEGGNLNRTFFYRQRALSTFNGGQGVVLGAMRVKLSSGLEAQVDMTGAKTVGDVMTRLNAVPGLTAAVNATGDGLLLTDGTGGASDVVIEDLDGNVAAGLNLSGVFAGPTIDRSFEFQITVNAGDTLNDIMQSVSAATALVTANTFSDGSGTNPARLAITGKGSGRWSTVRVSTDFADLDFQQTSRAQDAVMLFGSTEGGGEPQVLRSRNGTFSSIIPGVTLDLLGLSDSPITVGISRDLQSVADDVSEMVDAFNSVAARIDEHTFFDPDTFETGPLHGNSGILSLDASLRRMFLDPVASIPSATNNVTAVGISIGSDGKLTLDADALMQALTDRFDQVVELFTHSAELTDNVLISKLNNGSGIDTASGDDLRLHFRDGTTLDIDLDGVVDVGDLITRFNADPRVAFSIGPDGRHFELVDNTAGGDTFTIEDLNGSGSTQSLGFLSSVDTGGTGKLTGVSLTVSDQLGVARRLDSGIERYVDTIDGIFKGMTKAADDRIERYNEDIERLQTQIDMERVRLERQFAALEQFLAESQTIQAQLESQLQVISGNNKK